MLLLGRRFCTQHHIPDGGAKLSASAGHRRRGDQKSFSSQMIAVESNHFRLQLRGARKPVSSAPNNERPWPVRAEVCRSAHVGDYSHDHLWSGSIVQAECYYQFCGLSILFFNAICPSILYHFLHRRELFAFSLIFWIALIYRNHYIHGVFWNYTGSTHVNRI